MWDAVVAKKDGPPADLRYLKKIRSKVSGDTATARVVSFLESLYESVAETLPDVKDDGIVTELKESPLNQGDGYAEKLTVHGASSEPIRMMTTATHRKLPRKRKMTLDLHTERHPDNSGLETRWLPPSTMKEHFETMRNVDGREKVSFSVFWRTWHVEFPHLKIRAATTHSQCATCLRHKLLVRELSNHLLARKKQQDLLGQHLMAQYRDRQVYWSLRGSSRLRCITHIVIIADGMDQMKFSYPRSSLMTSKDFCTFQRPKLQVTGCIVHGYGLYFAVSNSDHPKDSSACTEILAHVLTRLRRNGIPLENAHIHLQADNTPRETKNNTTLRFLSALVSHRTLLADI